MAGTQISMAFFAGFMMVTGTFPTGHKENAGEIPTNTMTDTMTINGNNIFLHCMTLPLSLRVQLRIPKNESVALPSEAIESEPRA